MLAASPATGPEATADEQAAKASQSTPESEAQEPPAGDGEETAAGEAAAGGAAGDGGQEGSSPSSLGPSRQQERVFVLGLLGVVAAAFFGLFVRALEQGERLAIETHWGGYGGGLGGWRISRSLAYLLIALLFSGLFVTVYLRPGSKATEVKAQVSGTAGAESTEETPEASGADATKPQG